MSEGKRAGSSRRKPRGRQPRQKQGHGSSILRKCVAVTLVESSLFPTHYKGIKQSEIANQNQRGRPGMCGDGSAEDQEEAAQIERIPRVSVRSRGSENFLFVQISRRAHANPQANRADERAGKNAFSRRPREPQSNHGQWIAEAYAPAREKGCSAHLAAPMQRHTASYTSSTVMASIDGCGCEPRSCVVRTPAVRSTMSLCSLGSVAPPR